MTTVVSTYADEDKYYLFNFGTSNMAGIEVYVPLIVIHDFPEALNFSCSFQ